MKKRILAMLLAVATALSMIAVPANAASTLEEAMAEVEIYGSKDDLNYLAVNGSVKTQHYTYYRYRSAQTGAVTEIPAYCVDPYLKGVPQLAPNGSTPIKYSATETVSDPKVCGIIANGYPHMTFSDLGVNSVEEAYYATKTALWCYLLDTWPISGLSVNPNLTGAGKEAAQRVLKATKDIYQRGMYWTKLVEPRLTAAPDSAKAYPVTIDGEDCYQQEFTVVSETWSLEPVMLSLGEGAPVGAKILDKDNQEVSRLYMADAAHTDDGYTWTVKVVYPRSAIEGQSGIARLTLRATVVQYAIYFAKCLETDKYGNIQQYMLDTDPQISLTASAISAYSDDTEVIPEPEPTPDPDPEPEEPKESLLTIYKREEGTNLPLDGAVFQVLYPDGSEYGSFSTSGGKIELPVTVFGNYTVTELTAPRYHLLPEARTQNVSVSADAPAELTFWNAPYGSLRVEKTSDTGEKLVGVTVQAKNLETGEVLSAQTGPGGVCVFTPVKPGGWEIRETAGIEGWQLDGGTVKTATVVAGETTTVQFVNKELPGLKIRKYDRSGDKLAVMPDVTFEIWRDGASLGRFQTDEMGEIRLLNAQPGTYVAQEADAGSAAYLLDRTPQQIELRAGDGIRELVFFNDRKPSISRLIKVDSADLSRPIANAVFEIKAVDGSYGPVEMRTLEDGTISLENLPVGAYVVTEKSCPGYVIDDAQRIIQLRANDKAQFVFTNSKLPSLHLVKADANGDAVAGASYRLSRIADASRYLDRTTSGTGEITWDGLEPGVYSLVEADTRPDLILDPTEYHVEVFAGKTSEVVLTNHFRPNLYIYKYTAGTTDPVANCVFTVRAADGHSVDEIRTGANGRAELRNLLPGVYEITEKSVPDAWLRDAPSQLVTLYRDRDHTAYFYDSLRPSLTVRKVSSVTGEPLEGAKFHVEYASGSTRTGEINDLGYYTGADGTFTLDRQNEGWYRITEAEAPAGYARAETPREFFLKAGESKTVTVEDVPLSAIVIWKYDNVTKAALSSCWFELRYLSGTSGTGGTVIKTVRTGPTGSATITGLKKGTYIVTELSGDGLHAVDAPPQTVYLSGEDQEVVECFFGDTPNGSVLIRKVDGDGHPLGGCEFLVTTADGTLAGDANGVYVTDASGTALIENRAPGETLVIRETRAKDESYVLDDTPRTVRVKPGVTTPVEFVNLKKGNLILLKRSAEDKKTPVEGARFELRYADGRYVDADGGKLSSNGIYSTDAQGKIQISGIVGTVVATELESAAGYAVDEATRTQTVVVRPSDTQTLTFYNEPVKYGTLVIRKYVDGTKNEPIAGVGFKVTDGSGAGVGPDGGTYYTNAAGEIVLTGLEPGTTVTAREFKVPEGMELDGTPQSILIKAGMQQMTFYNKKLGALVIRKLSSADRRTPLEGVEFLLTYADGSFVDTANGQISSNGVYYTDSNGEIRVSGITGTVVVTERKSIPGYRIGADRTQTVVVRADDTQTLTFYNDPDQVGRLELVKEDAAVRGKRLGGAKYEIRKMDQGVVTTLTTGDDGRAEYPLVAGSYYAVEVEAPEGYKLDPAPHYFTIADGKTSALSVTDKAVSGIEVHKVDAITGKGVYGAKFLVYDSRNNVVGQLSTDDRGYDRIEVDAGRYRLRELECEGYIVDTQLKTVEVKSGEVTLVEWKNTPITGQIQITKTSADYNSMNGWPAGTPIPNTEFEVYNRAGNLVDTVKTDKNGVAATKPLPLGRYKIIESKAADFYGLDKTPIEVEIEFAGQIVRAAMTNKSLYTNVSITKRGYVEVMPGQTIRYDFFNIANNSTVSLQSFYFRDTLPTNAVRLDKIVTGTWNAKGNYKIVYKTNLSGEYRTLADNLSTGKSYVLNASSAALGLGSDEYVAEFMYAFGVVPANFRQVEAPIVYCKVLSSVIGGTEFTNTADAGGVYDGQWIMAADRWVTRVYQPAKPLPRTGY